MNLIAWIKIEYYLFMDQGKKDTARKPDPIVMRYERSTVQF